MTSTHPRHVTGNGLAASNVQWIEECECLPCINVLNICSTESGRISPILNKSILIPSPGGFDPQRHLRAVSDRAASAASDPATPDGEQFPFLKVVSPACKNASVIKIDSNKSAILTRSEANPVTHSHAARRPVCIGSIPTNYIELCRIIAFVLSANQMTGSVL